MDCLKVFSKDFLQICLNFYNKKNSFISTLTKNTEAILKQNIEVILSKYICDGYQQQQPIVITQCFMCFTQSSDDYTILFNL